MELTIVLGDRLLSKKRAVDSALAEARIDPQEVDVFCLDPIIDENAIIPHANPDYVVRISQQRRAWKTVLKSVRSSNVKYAVIVASAYGETSAGPELVLPIDVLHSLARYIASSGGTFEIICLIDDVFGSVLNRSVNLTRSLNTRQLEWTFAQYIGSQFSGKSCPLVSCFSLHHPITNLANRIIRKASASVYLCYPINFFRRDPNNPLKEELEKFKLNLTKSGLIVYDPMGIDEEVLISTYLGERTSKTLKIRPSDRWRIMPESQILFTEPELDENGRGITIFPPTQDTAKQAKSQVPQRDFFWIESSDVVISWRPFLGGIHHAGVLSELQFAIHKNKPILAFSPKEDGEEHPSPFASMVATLANMDDFNKAIANLLNY